MICTSGVGKVSYLGGHEYETKLPISSNPKTQGTRLFLNSLFEASCTTWEGQPLLQLVKSGPATTTAAEVTYTLYYINGGAGPALGLNLTDTLPPGSSFVSCTGGCTESGGVVTWLIGDVGGGGLGSVQLTVSLAQHGVYENKFSAGFTVGINTKLQESNIVSTDYQDSFPDASVPDFGALDAGSSDATVADGAQVLLDHGLPGDGISWPDGWRADLGPQDGSAAGEGHTVTEGGPGDQGAPSDSNQTGDNGLSKEGGVVEMGGVAEAGSAQDLSVTKTDGQGKTDSAATTPGGGQGGDAGGCDCAVGGSSPPWSLSPLFLLWWLRRRARHPR